MNTQLVVRDEIATKLEQVLVVGNLQQLTSEERVVYYKQVCESVGLNPLTKPFEYITLNGKLTLYARKDCTDQLRKVHDVSVNIVAREYVEGCYVVTSRAKLPSGREDESIGAVPVENLKGEARANALMKAETKSKRRVTLSICGLGILDESEIETIPPSRAKFAEVTETDIPLKPADKVGGGQVGGNLASGPGPAEAVGSVGIIGSTSTASTPILPYINQVQEAAKKATDKPQPVEYPGCATPGMQIAFARAFKDAAPKDLKQKEIELIRHDWLGRNGYVDPQGNPTSAAIRSDKFELVKKQAVQFARDLGKSADAIPF